MATYNREHLIVETLYSIQNQTYENWECIIVDDYSVDSTKDVIAEFMKGDSRFSYYLKTSKYNKGLSGTRNHGLDIAASKKAHYIQFFDDDDIMHRQKLELQIQPFMIDLNLNFSICKFEKLIENGVDLPFVERPVFELLHSHIGDAILTGKLKLNSLNALWNMDVLNRFRFDEDLSYAEEWELFTRIGYHYPNNYAVVDEYLFTYRKHSDTLTLGEDLNYQKRKTSYVIRIKIFEYLTQHKLHTKTSIIFLAKNFLLVSNDFNCLSQLIEYIKKEKKFSFKMRLFFKLSLFVNQFYVKIINKLASWV